MFSGRNETDANPVEVGVAELDDSPGKVYLIGVSSDAPDDLRDWFMNKGQDRLRQEFYNAHIIVVPGLIGSETDVTALDSETLEELKEE